MKIFQYRSRKKSTGSLEYNEEISQKLEYNEEVSQKLEQKDKKKMDN